MAKDVSAVVLAGGAGLRMGKQNKAFLKLGDKPIIEWLLSRLFKVFDDVLIVTDTPDLFKDYHDVKITKDKIIRPKRSTLAGIHAGLHEIKTSYGFVVACDMPFINIFLIKEMIKLCNGYEIIIPCYKGHVEATFALYHKRCLPFIEENLLNDNYKIINFFSNVRVKYLSEEFTRKIDPEFNSFLNLNTPGDLEKAVELIKEN